MEQDDDDVRAGVLHGEHMGVCTEVSLLCLPFVLALVVPGLREGAAGGGRVLASSVSLLTAVHVANTATEYLVMLGPTSPPASSPAWKRCSSVSPNAENIIRDRIDVWASSKPPFLVADGGGCCLQCAPRRSALPPRRRRHHDAERSMRKKGRRSGRWRVVFQVRLADLIQIPIVAATVSHGGALFLYRGAHQYYVLHMRWGWLPWCDTEAIYVAVCALSIMNGQRVHPARPGATRSCLSSSARGARVLRAPSPRYFTHILQPLVLISPSPTRQLLLWCCFDDFTSIWVLGSSFFFYLRQRHQQYFSVVDMFLLRLLYRPTLHRHYVRSVHLGIHVFDVPANTPTGRFVLHSALVDDVVFLLGLRTLMYLGLLWRTFMYSGCSNIENMLLSKKKNCAGKI